MRLNADQLSNHLQRELAPVYLVCGDEPLQVMESTDLLRQTARDQGYTERELFHADASFDWSTLLLAADSMSLFAERRLIEIRLPSGKPGSSGAKVLERLVNQPSPDTCLLVVTGKLDAGTKRSKWYRAFETGGVVVQVWPLKPAQLPQWIRQRLQQHGMQATNDAIRLLTERVQGNLLAADQEVRKLRMLHDVNEIDVEQVMQSVGDSSRHDVFGFVDGILQQDRQSLPRMLGHMRAEGVQVPVVLWALARELRAMFYLADAVLHRRPLEVVCREHQVWDSRRGLVTAAAKRQPPAYWQRCLARCGKIDRMAKGQAAGNCWDELLQLGIRMAR